MAWILVLPLLRLTPLERADPGPFPERQRECRVARVAEETSDLTDLRSWLRLSGFRPRSNRVSQICRPKSGQSCVVARTRSSLFSQVGEARPRCQTARRRATPPLQSRHSPRCAWRRTGSLQGFQRFPAWGGVPESFFLTTCSAAVFWEINNIIDILTGMVSQRAARAITQRAHP